MRKRCFLMAIFTSLCGCGINPHVTYRIEPRYTVADPQFRQSLGNLLGPPIVGGNRVTALINGKEIFPAMLAGIASAQKTIDFETYIFWSGEVGRQFTDALSERARAGVKVHLVIDAVGSAKINHEYVRQLTDAGAHVVTYHPLQWYDPTSAERLNNRTHRKLLIVDGKVGFIGGVGIADEWEGDADSPNHWRDSHYRVEGPVVAQLQAAFLDNWMKTTGQVLHGDEYFPFLPNVDADGKGGVGQWAQAFKSSAQGGSQSMQLLYLLSLAAAHESVLISSAYFVTDELTIDAMLAARQRGIRVIVIVPGRAIDEKFVRTASRAHWGKLLEVGVEMYEYQPTMYHCKMMIVDEQWVSIGSSNFDDRSFRLNDEANLNVLDSSFAAAQARVFEQDLGRSHRITLEEWKKRPLFQKLMEPITLLFDPLL